MSRHFRVLYADKSQGRSYRVRTYVYADSADVVRAMFSAFTVVSVKEVK